MKILKSNLIRFVLVAGLAVMLPGCGGGSGSASETPVTVFPVDSVITRLATTGGSFEGSRNDPSGARQTLTVTYTQNSPGQFTRLQTLTKDGATQQSEAVIVSFLASPFRLTGMIDQALNPVAISQSDALPVSASLGESANMMVGSQFIQNNGLSTTDVGLTHSIQYGWSLATNTTKTAELCMRLTVGADFISTQRLDCFVVDSLGSISTFRGILRTHSKSIDTEEIYH
jgi:hypothetical protein